MHRRNLILRLVVVFGLVVLPAFAAPRDKAALKKIDEAVNEHYLATDFKKAEDVLLGTIKACGDKCSPGVVARAYMYVGIVRGSGNQDQDAAREAFKQAFAADPNIALDDALATPPTKATFDEVAAESGAGAAPGGAGEPAEAAPEELEEAAAPADADVPGSLECTPQVNEVETRRPIPVSCAADGEAVRVELRYKEFAGDGWKTVKMQQRDETWQALIPCSATQTSGTFRYYVVAKDAAGDILDSRGSKSKPVTLELVAQTDAEPPAYPGEEPPSRCAEEVECPPDFPGCSNKKKGGKGWGATCEASSECAEGLMCSNGSCENAPSCETDADCGGGSCQNGFCSGGDTKEGGGSYAANWIGLHVAQDIAMVSGSDVCAPGVDNNFVCYSAGDVPFSNTPGATVNGGTSVATTRVLLSFERALSANLTLGMRLGYAFRGAPEAFMPFHGEGRLAYYFGQNALGKAGVRPYLHVGGGVAQVDAKVLVQFNLGDPPQAVDIAAWKSMGTVFATAGGGLLFALSPSGGLQLNLNAMMFFPSSGVAFEPSLGYVVGF